MKTLKIIDVAGQIIVTMVAIFLWNDMSFFIFYFGVGAWQVISCLVHAVVVPRRLRNESRKTYEVTLVVVLIFGWFILLGMLYIGIIMATWYMATCCVEVNSILKHKRRKWFEYNPL
jgi:hypothetical protein